MLQYPNINPIAVQIGAFKIHWYGLMYLLGIGAGWLLANKRTNDKWRGWTKDQVTDLVFYIAVGIIVGGRVGYMLFYDFNGLIAHPLSLFKTWQGGMSFHGGALGILTAVWIFSWRHKKPYWSSVDFVAPLVTIGLAAGRIGNFINGELYGRVTNVPWGMVFPNGGPLPRHPSQLYEFFLEGVCLFIILWIFSKKPRPGGSVTGLCSLTYGVFRFGVEFFRQPDPQLGFVAFGWLTRGQELCIPMIIGGAFLFIWSYRKQKLQPSIK